MKTEVDEALLLGGPHNSWTGTVVRGVAQLRVAGYLNAEQEWVTYVYERTRDVVDGYVLYEFAGIEDSRTHY